MFIFNLPISLFRKPYMFPDVGGIEGSAPSSVTESNGTSGENGSTTSSDLPGAESGGTSKESQNTTDANKGKKIGVREQLENILFKNDETPKEAVKDVTEVKEDLLKGKKELPLDDASKTTETEIAKALKAAGINNFKDAQSFIRSYKEMESLKGRMGQENASLKKALSEFKLKDKSDTQKVKQQPAIDETPAAEVSIDQEEWLQDFYEKPLTMLDEYIKKAQQQTKRSTLRELQSMKKDIEPIKKIVNKEQKQKQWNDAAATFAKTHTDLGKFSKEITSFYKAHPEMAKTKPLNFLETAYNYVKGVKSNTQKSPAELANDTDFLNKYILNNDNIKQSILQNHMKTIKDSKPPNVISGDKGQSLATPPNKPKTMKEAHDFLANLVNQ